MATANDEINVSSASIHHGAGLRMDSRSQMEIVQSEDTALITLAQDLDLHTAALRKSVLDTVRGMRSKIATQATEMIDGERARSREYERRLLAQIDSLQRLLDQRTHDLESERSLSERLVVLHQVRARRRSTRDLAAEGLRRWHHYVAEQKRRERLCAFLTQARKERVSRQIFNTWRFEILKQKQAAQIEKITGDYRRAQARMQSEHQTVENAAKLEMLAMRENLSKEEERRAVLEERLKAAFMRGVCALNMEAMQVLRTAPQDGDVSVASLLQAINLTSSTFDSAGAEPASTDRLMRQQEALQAQLLEMEQRLASQQQLQVMTMPPDVSAALHPARGATAPMVVRARAASSASARGAAAAQPDVRVTLHPRPSGPNVEKKPAKLAYGALSKADWRS